MNEPNVLLGLLVAALAVDGGMNGAYRFFFSENGMDHSRDYFQAALAILMIFPAVWIMVQ